MLQQKLAGNRISVNVLTHYLKTTVPYGTNLLKHYKIGSQIPWNTNRNLHAFYVCALAQHRAAYGSHYSLNVHNICRENVKTNITLHVAGGCEKHRSCRWPWLVLLSWRAKSRRSACVAGDSGRWTMMLLIIFREIGTSTCHTRSLTLASISICSMRAAL